MADPNYLARPLIAYECPTCGREHSNRTRNRVCGRCQHVARRGVCPDCGGPRDGRAVRCNLCAIQVHVRLHERGKPTFHKPSGYWLVKVPVEDPMASMRNAQGYVRQHRLVMADELGRPLTDDEHVHHVDHDRGNNDPANLRVMDPAEHHRLHATERHRAAKEAAQ